MKNNCDHFMHYFGWVFLIGCIAFAILSWGAINNMGELGQAICEGEYGMNYVGYYDKVLKCKPVEIKPIKIHYDGIEVDIGG